MSMIDLRSDTATKPSPEMRRYMAEAEVGDEQIREDPTVNRLQEMVAELTGMEEALFLPSGTMCNAIGIKLHTQPGDKIVLERGAHPYTSEAGGPGLLAGVMTSLVDGERGVYTTEQLEEVISPVSYHSAPTSLVLLENTHNKGGGKIWPLEQFNAIADTAHKHNAKAHLDGARLLNAVVASDIPARVWCEKMDTAWIDLSKGLGAPVGGVLAGSKKDMETSRRYKHMFGGAMRQAGIIAAAGVYALENNVDRMADDHDNAKLLARGLSEIPGITTDPAEVETNIVFWDVKQSGHSPKDVAAKAKEQGVLIGPQGDRIRCVTHLDVSRDDCERTVQVIADVMKQLG